MSETISYLIGPFAAVVAGAVFYFLARRETSKAAALVEQMKNEFHRQIEEQVRRLQPSLEKPPEVPIPEDVKEQTANFVRGAFRLLNKQSKELAEELAEFNEQQQLANERIESGVRRTQSAVI
jgi:gas vesicle protein